MPEFYQWLETTAVAMWITQSDYGFVIAVGVHLLLEGQRTTPNDAKNRPVELPPAPADAR